MEEMKKRFSSVPKSVWILSCIVLAGVFLRTYQFHDWLRFNADQSRDAGVVSSVVEGGEAWPLLGPKAGGTEFRLGPAFYYFQIASATVFGGEPDKMAYPDLLFSILAIPLLFLFLRKYFDVKTALALTAIFAVSPYAIKYSRFAWNPNSLPFWSMLFLFGLHEIVTARENAGKAWLWPVVTGIALGIGVQLHTLSLAFFPIMLAIVSGLMISRRRKVWRAIFTIIIVATVLNAGQIYSEYGTGGKNIGAFLSGIGTKEKKGKGLANAVVKDATCFMDANAYILSSYDRSDTCELKGASKGYGSAGLVAGFLVFFGGLILAVRYFVREKDPDKKAFLGIFISYAGVAFLVLLPFSNEVSMRFFLVIVFMPFVLLGMWMKYLSERLPGIGRYAPYVLVVSLVVSNLLAVRNSFSEYAGYATDSDAGMDNVTLKEVELAAGYVVAHSGSSTAVSLGGDAKYLAKSLKSIVYLAGKNGVKVVRKGNRTDEDMPGFIIENTRQRKKILEKNPEIVEYESLGRFTIFRSE